LRGEQIGLRERRPRSTLDPAELGTLTDLWLGRSQFGADPYLEGAIDELVIHGGVLADSRFADRYRVLVFAGGFESGGTGRWSVAVP